MNVRTRGVPLTHFPINGDLQGLTPSDPVTLIRPATSFAPGWRLLVRPSESDIAVSPKVFAAEGGAGRISLYGLEARGALDRSYFRTEIEIDPKLWIERKPNVLSFFASSLPELGRSASFASICVCRRVEGRLDGEIVELAKSHRLGLSLTEHRLTLELDDAETLYRAACSAQEDGAQSLWLSFISRSPRIGFQLARVEFVTVTLEGDAQRLQAVTTMTPLARTVPVSQDDAERVAREKLLVRRIEQELIDLEKKLWGGFSELARRELGRIVGSNLAHPEARARAAWELARWSASQGDYVECLAMLRSVRTHSKVFARRRNVRLIEYFALTSLGAFKDAIEAIERARVFNKDDANFSLSLANVYLAMAEAGEMARADADARRLAEINAIYAKDGLLPVFNSDASEPLTISRLRCDTRRHHRSGGPKVSVLMAAFNAEEHLEIAVDSMLGQTWRNLELVIVDDCSEDRTWDKIKSYEKRDSRVKALRNETNMGAYPTRNRALAVSDGDYVTVHDSDDWSHPQMLERQIDLLLTQSSARFSFSMMSRVTEDLRFGVRPSRRNMEIVHRSYPSLMISRADLAELGVWDGVRANADAELVKRARMHFGDAAMADAAGSSPLSFFLVRPESLTEQRGTGLLSLTFGARHEYDRQADYVHRQMMAAGAIGLPKRTSRKAPFASPSGLLPKELIGSRHYDIILISDLSLKGGTRSCNLSYIDAATASGKRVGLFHWPRGDLKLLPDIEPGYRDRNQTECVDIITCDEEVSCDALIVHHPPIMASKLDSVPQIAAKSGYILVNQLPYQLEGQANVFYEPLLAERDFVRLFGLKPTWLPISPLVRRHLSFAVAHGSIDDVDWYPPLLMAERAKDALRSEGPLVIGRHARDHWTKWPADIDALKSAYCVDSDIEVRLLGGADHAVKLLGRVPPNWQVLEFDSVAVEDFIDQLDALIHFPNEEYIEEFGRTVAEAMARSVPCILPHKFEEVFGSAALYCAPEDVPAVLRKLVADPVLSAEIASRGRAFVRAHCSATALARRLDRVLGRPLSDARPEMTPSSRRHVLESTR
ncbi:glycosyltransferase [Hansschlegelia zhihuaiae]|uniref:Glycosyltransferase n=1 Tax=Hansschlegelia zhihuaiae TaxID=405005 RepID=A0A4V1KJJ9_9HYPH|nr:glycosyltransferase [Hansschlegelia zhihuaiae]RXF74452.1 glycosyltransferase [Hansschlegelia zhihuaiae]